MPAVVHHDIICQHQVEVEVWPAVAEVYYQDERYIDPVNTQVQFDAVVYNAPTDKVTWQVRSLSGGPGAGTIDAAGLYKSPPKGMLPHGLTDIIVATSVDNPFRKAYARVSLIGRGPEPPPIPKLEIFPRWTHLYRDSGYHNDHIDESNTMQLFQTIIRNTTSKVKWQTNDGPSSVEGSSYLYKPTGFSNPVTITASLVDDPSIKDEAKVILINYSWPGIV